MARLEGNMDFMSKATETYQVKLNQRVGSWSARVTAGSQGVPGLGKGEKGGDKGNSETNRRVRTVYFGKFLDETMGDTRGQPGRHRRGAF